MVEVTSSVLTQTHLSRKTTLEAGKDSSGGVRRCRYLLELRIRRFWRVELFSTIPVQNAVENSTEMSASDFGCSRVCVCGEV